MPTIATSGAFEVRKFFETQFVGNFVVESATHRLLGGVGNNNRRAWAFPLNTPRGLTVLQEFAYDHPFHNGIFVGQGRVTCGAAGANFWCTDFDRRQAKNPVMQDLDDLRYEGTPEVAPIENGFVFTYRTTWRDARGAAYCDEVRTFELRALADGTACEVTSTKTAAHGPVTFEKSKHGSIGVRLQAQILPLLGGSILAGRAGGIERGTHEDVVGDAPADFVAYEADAPGLGRFGIAMAVTKNSASPDRAGPWFVRNYGMAMFNATKNAPIALAAGESWTAAARYIAYDGGLTPDRAAGWFR